LLKKQVYKTGTTTQVTDYVDGFVYINGTLSYFPIPEGRVLNSGGTFTQEFIIGDQQGNARISFKNNGSNVAVVTQENSYYGFGMAYITSTVPIPTVPNKQLYNGGSEWQNDYSNMPDYYQTFFRNYDAVLGRFVGVDPAPEGASDLTTYNYAGNNPIRFNDPMGDYQLPATGGVRSDLLGGMLGDPYMGAPMGARSDAWQMGDDNIGNGSIQGDVDRDIATAHGVDPDGVNEGRYLTTDASGTASQNYGMARSNAIALHGANNVGTLDGNLYVKRQFGITDERGKVWDTGYDLVKVQANHGGEFNYLDPSSINLVYGTKGPNKIPMYFATLTLPSYFSNGLPFAVKIGGKIEKSVNVKFKSMSIGLNMNQVGKYFSQVGFEGLQNTIAYSFDEAGKTILSMLGSGLIQSYDSGTATEKFFELFQFNMQQNFRANDIGVYQNFPIPGAPKSTLQFIDSRTW
ncbi:hypothetical protein KXD93_30460, partial [Mucilaginibacter sp. BJC16-A38]|uniref:RHS repeat-associated core domain-containing protein n=1 Tax=Mucilaginibacter phenanthrenivorans TaxID=1234842 RepID=UPI00280AA052